MFNDKYQTEYGYMAAKVQRFDAYQDMQKGPSNVLFHSNPELPDRFWATKAGEQNWFILDFGKPITINAIKLVNTRCPPLYDGRTNEFRYSSVDSIATQVPFKRP